METEGLLLKKFITFLQPLKDDNSLKTICVCYIPCKCGKVYNGHTGHYIETRIKEHHWDFQFSCG